MSCPSDFPCPRCGVFRGGCEITCTHCGWSPNAGSPQPSPTTNEAFSLFGLYQDTVFVLIAQPLMMFVGYPIGFLVLKAFSLGRARLGPWNNNGEPYDLCLGHVFKRIAKTENAYTMRTELVAVIGWNIGVLIAVAVLVLVNS